MYFAFWDIVSCSMFTTMLTMVDAKTIMLWIFCTSSKKQSIHIPKCVFANLRQEQWTLANIHVDEDGALDRSADFTTYLCDDEQLNLQTTGGYATFSVAKSSNLITHSLLVRIVCLSMHLPLPSIDATPPSTPLVFIALRTIPPLQVTPISHGTVKSSMLRTFTYGTVVFLSQGVLVPGHNLKKSRDRAVKGKFYCFAKTWSLLCWFDLANNNIKHTHGARFLGLDRLHPNPPIGQILLDLDPGSTSRDIECPMLEIDIGDRAHFDTEPIHVTVDPQPVGSPFV
jgi:hypothetical protein